MKVSDYFVAGNPETSVLELFVLAGNEDPAVRLRVAENPASPHFLLLRLVADLDPDVRLAVASNPRVSVQLLEWLAEDRSVDVRFAMAEDHRLPLPMLVKLQHDSNAYVAWRAASTVARIHEDSEVQETWQTEEGEPQSQPRAQEFADKVKRLFAQARLMAEKKYIPEKSSADRPAC